MPLQEKIGILVLARLRSLIVLSGLVCRVHGVPRQRLGSSLAWCRPFRHDTNADIAGSIPSFYQLSPGVRTLADPAVPFGDLALRSVAVSIGESERKVCKVGSDLQETKPQPPDSPERVIRQG